MYRDLDRKTCTIQRKEGSPMNAIKKFFLTIFFIVVFIISPNAYAKEYHSFVDEMVDDPRVFEEDPADEFLAEKREINRLVIEENFEAAFSKINKLEKKVEERYGQKYIQLAAWDISYAINRVHIIRLKKRDLTYNNSNLSKDALEKLKQRLNDEATFKKSEAAIKDMIKNLQYPTELIFSTYRENYIVCKDILGESDPRTLKEMLKLIPYYSLLGDSKTALDMEKDAFPKIKKVFGEKSDEMAFLLKIMAKDYKVLGKYKESEESLLKAIAINKKLHGEENSPELLSNIVELIRLKKATPDSDAALFEAMEKAAKDLPEDDLYISGYFFLKKLSEIPNRSFTLDNFDAYSKEWSNELNKISELIVNLDPVYRIDVFENSVLVYCDFGGKAKLQSLGMSIVSDLMTYNLLKLITWKYHPKVLMAYCNITDNYLTLNQTEDALLLAEKIYATSRKIYGDEHPCTIRAIQSLSNVYRKKGTIWNVEALEWDLKAYELSKKVFSKTSAGEPLEKLTILENIARDYIGLMQNLDARKYYEKLYETMKSDKAYNFKGEKIYPYTESRIYKFAEIRKNLAQIYNLNGEYEKTIALYDFMKKPNEEIYSIPKLRIEGELLAQTMYVLSRAFAGLGRNAIASEFYFSTIEEYEQSRATSILLSTDEDKKNWFIDIVPYYKNATSFLINQKNFADSFVIGELCKSRVLVEQYQEALISSKSGLSKEEIADLNQRQKELSWYNDKIKDALKNGNYNLAFDLRMLYAQLMSEYWTQKLQIGKNNTNYLSKQMNIFKQGIADMFLSKTMEEYIPQNYCYISFTVLSKYSNKILAFVVNEEGNIKGVNISIDDNFFKKCKLYRDLLAYHTIENMRRDNKYLWRLPDGSYKITLNRQSPAPNAVNIKNSKDLDDIRQELSAQLGNILLAPLSNNISSKTNWIISPDGELNNIPFETLQFNGKMAIESADICYVPSFAVLELMKEMGEKNSKLPDRKEIFAMGNSVYSDLSESELRKIQTEFFKDIKRSPSNSYIDLTKMKWANLTKTGEELKNVSALFPANSQEIVTGIDASERNLKQRDKDGQLAQYKYILFAAHGFFLQEKPELSSIVLSQGLGDKHYDGYVTISEWFGYNLNSDLVYLSACESGLGDYQSGEGIVGLPYALTVAGNKDTVMSLWKIDDEAAAEFASLFFSKLKDGKTEVQALNETKREFLSSPNPKFKNPSSWAAFLLYGI